MVLQVEQVVEQLVALGYYFATVAQHLDTLNQQAQLENIPVEQHLQNNTQEQPVIPQQPEITTEEPAPPPLLDEKEQFYKRQQEILEQYKQFNNKLNLN